MMNFNKRSLLVRSWIVALAALAMVWAGCGGSPDSSGNNNNGGSSITLPKGAKWAIKCSGAETIDDSNNIVSIINEDSDSVIIGLNNGKTVESFLMTTGKKKGATGEISLPKVAILIGGKEKYLGGSESGTTFTVNITEWEPAKFNGKGPKGTFKGELKATDGGATLTCDGQFDFDANPF